ncbi:exopolysaccharide biosynthesis protein [Roseomonas marmotae]|uniref:Exopolysaccharide biosynthesis protein n=1 Tax=Roseomonas marmotae TaxID=2768161 RepID=A0ABS3KG96_9PROT|nr:exopolysaccharide biosynthesis protein [Roseomonas marmotae]MBO1075992.1 exopolysaccharide biosynthesis protein [Roseomonas marmotae]QTI80125.1 exopolysaccharide biosynthesis protein [Roseomonas marmotae]
MPDHLPPAPPPAATEAVPGIAHDETAPISRIVAEVAATFPGERISLGDMADAFGERAFGLLILLLCLPSLLPGMASVFGLPMLVLGAQMGLGLRKPRLPAIMAQRTVRRSDLLRLASASSGGLRRVERFLRPRPGWFTSPLGERLVGWLTVWAALMLILPGPGTNGPPAFGTIVMALGVVEQDSRVTAWGVGLTIAGCLLASAVLAVICLFGMAAFTWLF